MQIDRTYGHYYIHVYHVSHILGLIHLVSHDFITLPILLRFLPQGEIGVNLFPRFIMLYNKA